MYYNHQFDFPVLQFLFFTRVTVKGAHYPYN